MFSDQSKPETYSLNVLWNGLSHLYSYVRAQEQNKAAAEAGSGTSVATDFGSSDPGDLILNHFFWYASSFLPFIDLFDDAYTPSEILRREFAPLKRWRNKVSAHFSYVDSKGDNQMVQQASINQFLTWNIDRYSVGHESFSSATGLQSPKNWGWSLTEVHERMLKIAQQYA